MAEHRRRRNRRQARRNRRKKLAIVLIAVLCFIIVAAAGMLAAVSSPGPVRELAKDIFNEHFGGLRLVGAWTSNAEKAYRLMEEKRSELGDGTIPWLIESDQHGRKVPTAKWLHDKDQSVRHISLGDVTTDYFNQKELASFRKRMSSVGNKICVYGNHDIWTKSDEIANYPDLNQYFQSAGKKTDNGRGFFTVVDEAYLVKYLVISPYEIREDAKGNGVDVTIRTDQMTWLLEELSADDGYDIIVLAHQPLTDMNHSRTGEMQSGGDAPPILEALWNVMKDRRNKRSGSITDGEGVVHEYDFTGKATKILCCLHGHMHQEMLQTDESMTAYVADWLSDEYNCAFGLIDRRNDKLYIWKFNKSRVYDVLTLDI